MNEIEIIEQLEGLIEAWQLDEASLNQTDINAIERILDKNKQLKEQLEASEKAGKEVIDKATNELFILKDMIYKPETREENFEIQRKISSIIKRLNGKEVSK